MKCGRSCFFYITCCVTIFLKFLCAVRALVFGAIWIALGKRVWIFPNILAEEATLKDLFRFWPPKDEEEGPKWTSRLFYAAVAALVIILLRHHAPDEAARARSVLIFKQLNEFIGAMCMCRFILLHEIERVYIAPLWGWVNKTLLVILGHGKIFM